MTEGWKDSPAGVVKQFPGGWEVTLHYDDGTSSSHTFTIDIYTKGLPWGLTTKLRGDVWLAKRKAEEKVREILEMYPPASTGDRILSQLKEGPANISLLMAAAVDDAEDYWTLRNTLTGLVDAGKVVAFFRVKHPVTGEKIEDVARLKDIRSHCVHPSTHKRIPISLQEIEGLFKLPDQGQQ